MNRLLARLTTQQLEAMLGAKKRLAKAEPLKRKLVFLPEIFNLKRA
jgi:hypothetical protein